MPTELENSQIQETKPHSKHSLNCEKIKKKCEEEKNEFRMKKQQEDELKKAKRESKLAIRLHNIEQAKLEKKQEEVRYEELKQEKLHMISPRFLYKELTQFHF